MSLWTEGWSRRVREAVLRHYRVPLLVEPQSALFHDVHAAASDAGLVLHGFGEPVLRRPRGGLLQTDALFAAPGQEVRRW